MNRQQLNNRIDMFPIITILEYIKLQIDQINQMLLRQNLKPKKFPFHTNTVYIFYFRKI